VNRCAWLLLPALLAGAPAAAGAHPGPHERIAALTLVLERNPGDAGAWVELAAEHLADGRPDEALRDLDRAESLAPDLADVPRVRGEALLALGRAAEAEASLARALERAPGSADAYRLRARARLALGRPQDAAADFARCVDLSPAPSPDDFLEWSRALAAAGPKQSGPALAALDRGLATLGPSTALVEEAVALECARGAWDQALARIDRHAAAWGPAAARRARRGDVLSAAGRGLEAQAEWSVALAEIEAAPRRRTTPGALETRLRAALRGSAPERSRP
jgi:tetratricopeptide (TPR) repeat protein